MSITFDFSNILAIGQTNPLAIAWFIISQGGWVIFVGLFIVGAYLARLEFVRRRYRQTFEYILLAIDIPKENPQSMKAVEQIFAQLYAIETKGTLWERYGKGKVQDAISLEIVSIGGYIQYLVRILAEHRDLVEAAIFAQYPDAEITEVEDYVHRIPSRYPNEVYDLFGREFKLAKNSAYPIRTYVNFEHSLTEQFADPMVSILESLSRLHPAEEVWIQIVITPAGAEWKEEGDRLVKKLIGAKATAKSFFDGTLDLPARIARGFGESFLSLGSETNILGGISGSEAGAEENKGKSSMQFLSPGTRDVVLAVEEKLAKIGFHAKLRLVYAAPKTIFNKNRGAEPIAGAILQYNTQNLNAFKSVKKIKVDAKYLLVERRKNYRKRKLIRAYKLRADLLGAGKGSVLNIEELASIFHFPVTEVKAPLVKTTEGKKTEPPASIAIEQTSSVISSALTDQMDKSALPETSPAKSMPHSTTPDNLPIE